jgi:aminoglycoside phosphotransferase (APT) family kinase protein
VDLYAEKSGRNLSDIHFYLVLGYFRLAVIVQQIYLRWHRGQTRDERFAAFGPRVRGLIEHAHDLAGRGG